MTDRLPLPMSSVNVESAILHTVPGVESALRELTQAIRDATAAKALTAPQCGTPTTGGMSAGTAESFVSLLEELKSRLIAAEAENARLRAILGYREELGSEPED